MKFAHSTCQAGAARAMWKRRKTTSCCGLRRKPIDVPSPQAVEGSLPSFCRHFPDRFTLIRRFRIPFTARRVMGKNREENQLALRPKGCTKKTQLTVSGSIVCKRRFFLRRPARAPFAAVLSGQVRTLWMETDCLKSLATKVGFFRRSGGRHFSVTVWKGIHASAHRADLAFHGGRKRQNYDRLGTDTCAPRSQRPFASYDRPGFIFCAEANLRRRKIAIPDYRSCIFRPMRMSLASQLAELSQHVGFDSVALAPRDPHMMSAYLAMQLLRDRNASIPKVVTTLHGTDATLVGVILRLCRCTDFAFTVRCADDSFRVSTRRCTCAGLGFRRLRRFK